MKRKGFTLVELLAVIVLLGLVIVIVASNGFGIFNKAKKGIDKIEEDSLLESARTFLVDVENDFVTSYPNGYTEAQYKDEKKKINLVYEDNKYYKIIISSNDTITKTECTPTNLCGMSITVGYLENNLYFNDTKDKCDNDANLNLKILGKIEHNSVSVNKVGSTDICTKTDSHSIDYKLIDATKNYLKRFMNGDATLSFSTSSTCTSSVDSFYEGCEVTVSDLINNGVFTPDADYSCDADATLNLKIMGKFVTTDYVAEKEDESAIICAN